MRVEGFFDQDGRPRIHLRMAGFPHTFPAVIDTGFDGAICVHAEQADKSGLELTGEECYFSLATGEQVKFLLCEIEVDWFGRTLSKTMLVNLRTRQPEDDFEQLVLIGTELLSDCKVTIDYCSKSVVLEECHPVISLS